MKNLSRRSAASASSGRSSTGSRPPPWARRRRPSWKPPLPDAQGPANLLGVSKPEGEGRTPETGERAPERPDLRPPTCVLRPSHRSRRRQSPRISEEKKLAPTDADGYFLRPFSPQDIPIYVNLCHLRDGFRPRISRRGKAGRAATELREAHGVRGACSRFGARWVARKRQQAGRTPYASRGWPAEQRSQSELLLKRPWLFALPLAPGFLLQPLGFLLTRIFPSTVLTAPGAEMACLGRGSFCSLVAYTAAPMT